MTGVDPHVHVCMFLILCLIIVFFPTDSCKANEYADISMRKFDSIITDYMKEQRIPGGALAITLNGRIIHRQGVGNNNILIINVYQHMPYAVVPLILKCLGSYFS